MPLFEYECPNGHRSEALISWRDRQPTRPCDVCGAEAGLVASTSYFGGFAEPRESSVSRAIRKVKERGL